MEQEKLDITTIKTIEDINNTDFEKYSSEQFSNWLKHIVYPVSQDDLNRVNELSFQPGCEVELTWSMGDLYWRKRALPEIKVPKQIAMF